MFGIVALTMGDTTMFHALRDAAGGSVPAQSPSPIMFLVEVFTVTGILKTVLGPYPEIRCITMVRALDQVE